MFHIQSWLEMENEIVTIKLLIKGELHLFQLCMKWKKKSLSILQRPVCYHCRVFFMCIIYFLRKYSLLLPKNSHHRNKLYQVPETTVSVALSLFKTLWGIALATWQKPWIGYEFACWLFKRNNPFQKSTVCLNVFYLIEQNSLFASDPCYWSGVCVGSNTLKHDCPGLHTRVEDSQFQRKMWRQPKVLWQIDSVLAPQHSSTVPTWHAFEPGLQRHFFLSFLLLPQCFTSTSILFPMVLLCSIRTLNKTCVPPCLSG